MNLDIGLMTFDLQAVPGYARRAEEMGFGAIWSAETRHDPFLPLAVASITTSRVGLGTAIAVAFPRSPMVRGAQSRRPIARRLHLPHLISDEALEHFAVSGSFATIGERIRERYRGLYDRTQLYRRSSPRSTSRAGPPSWPAPRAPGGLCYNPTARGDR